jgi:hypothetical protein
VSGIYQSLKIRSTREIRTLLQGYNTKPWLKSQSWDGKINTERKEKGEALNVYGENDSP